MEAKRKNPFDVDDNDIVHVNVGGKVFLQARRSTLCQVEGSLFASIFSGRWEGSVQRDDQDRVFLDHDPEILEIIINFMRLKRIENPSKPLMPPTVPKEKQQAFDCLLSYFGLESLFEFPTPAFFRDFQVCETNGSRVTTTQTGSARQLLYNYGSNNYHFVCLGTPILDGDCWKITVQALPSSNYLCLGVIGNRNASNGSFSDTESYGWGGDCQVYIGGSVYSPHGGWNSFQQGDVVYFRLDQRELRMFVSNTAKHYSIHCDKIVHCPLHVHFNFREPCTTVLIDALKRSERREAGWM